MDIGTPTVTLLTRPDRTVSSREALEHLPARVERQMFAPFRSHRRLPGSAGPPDAAGPPGFATRPPG